MNVLCYSSFTFAYLNRARVLFQSLRRHHPDWWLVAVMTDRPPPGVRLELENEPFDQIVWAHELGIPDFPSWMFKHDIVEISTAVKGPFLYGACNSSFDAIIYLDPDTCVFNELTTVMEALEHSEIVLTPHQLDPDEDTVAIIDNEITSLKTGIYNLGFLAIRTGGEGRRFAKWWNDRLLQFCFDDIPQGLFVDQRWCDHVPAFFNNVHVLRDPGCNVASWNLSNRFVSVDDCGRVLVNSLPLKFWHFTKLGPVGDSMTKRYAKDNYPVYELWRWYRAEIVKATSGNVPKGYWYYGSYRDGTPIRKGHRLIYRERRDIQLAFPDPFSAGHGTFRQWLETEGLLEVEDHGFQPA